MAVPTVSIDTLNKDLVSDRLSRERRHTQWTLNYEPVTVPEMKDVFNELNLIDEKIQGISRATDAATRRSRWLQLLIFVILAADAFWWREFAGRAQDSSQVFMPSCLM